MAETEKAKAPKLVDYTNTRTGAIRKSTSPLGYPYVESPKATVEKAPDAK